MSYQSLIDDAISRARVKVASGLPQPTDKLASAHDGGALLGEAEKIANALEYMAMATADDGSAAGAARAEMVRDFFKTAAEADKKKGIMQPLVTETMTSGTQKVAPQTGKAKLNPQGLVSGDSPKQTTAPDGMMSRNAMEQTPSSSPTKSASLYDMLMGARMAKIAAESGAGAPRQMDSSQPPPGYQKGQEGGHAQGPLSTNESIVAAKRRELHAPSRDRLSELFAHSGDTAQSVASAAGTFPLAAAKGGMKVASLASAIQKEAGFKSIGSSFKDEVKTLGRSLKNQAQADAEGTRSLASSAKSQAHGEALQAAQLNAAKDLAGLENMTQRGLTGQRRAMAHLEKHVGQGSAADRLKGLGHSLKTGRRKLMASAAEDATKVSSEYEEAEGSLLGFLGGSSALRKEAELSDNDKRVAYHAMIGTAVPIVPFLGTGLAAHAAEKGTKGTTAAGQVAGYVGGAAAGSLLPRALTKSRTARALGGMGGAISGSGLGAGYAHKMSRKHKEHKEQSKDHNKKASIVQLAAAYQLGEAAEVTPGFLA